MKISILGCGSSVGNPNLGNGWGVCDPDNPKNRRRRASILVEKGEQSILVDVSPDVREQLIDAGVERLDSVLLTHSHADHVHGMDDLRPIYWRMGQPLPVYGDAETWEDVVGRFGYLFEKDAKSPPYFTPPLTRNVIAREGEFDLSGMHIKSFIQDHGVSGTCLGFIFDQRMAYSTDVQNFTDDDLHMLSGLDLWVVDCLRDTESAAHSWLERTLSWIEIAKPKRAILTHMANSLDYDVVKSQCPEGVEPGYDGMEIAL